jgi:Papain-like cysteine protease AvrRpt2
MTLTWQVTPISQKSIRLCWEACGHMLWNWHYKDEKVRAAYKHRAGVYSNMDTGLSQEEMDQFYKMLGLRCLENPRGENIVHALKWSPVIATSIDQSTGHAMVVDGHAGGHYMIINPCASQYVDFNTNNNDSCTVGITQIQRTEFNKN